MHSHACSLVLLFAGLVREPAQLDEHLLKVPAAGSGIVLWLAPAFAAIMLSSSSCLIISLCTAGVLGGVAGLVLILVAYAFLPRCSCRRRRHERFVDEKLVDAPQVV